MGLSLFSSLSSLFLCLPSFPFPFFFILFRGYCCCPSAASWLNFRLLPLFFLIGVPMDHAQGRAFHHHLARAIMHLNHLAGLLPFFEPSIEWDDGMPRSNFRLEHSASRGLHTFVPLPPASNPPSMVAHAGIPSQMIVNPEPNLRPISVFSTPHPDLATTPVPMSTTRSPSTRTEPAANPPWHYTDDRSSTCPHQDHHPGTCSFQTTCRFSRRSTTEETPEGCVSPGHPCTSDQKTWQS